MNKNNSMIDMCPSYRPTMNSNMSSISLYNNKLMYVYRDINYIENT